MSKKKNKWTGERLETFFVNSTTIEHLHRYFICEEIVKNKVVLDIACGEGYGSKLLSKNSKFVYGVDIDSSTIKKAVEKYDNKNIKFLTGSTSKIPLDDNLVDVVISFETIEHHDEHQLMIDEIKRVLKPDGIVIISTPDKSIYSDKRNYVNHFHVKELYYYEFRDLLEKNFKKINMYGQIYLGAISYIDKFETFKNSIVYSGNFDGCQKSIGEAKYLIAIMHDTDTFDENYTFNKSYYNGFQEINQFNINQIYNTKSYKIGRIILYPINYMNNMIRTILKRWR